MKKEQITNKFRHNNSTCDEGQEKGTIGDFKQKTTDKIHKTTLQRDKRQKYKEKEAKYKI